MKVKICGVRSLNDVEACVAAGADLIGLNFVPSSRRFLSLSNARVLADRVPKQGIAVFSSPRLAEVEQVLQITKLRIVQLHGPLEHGLIERLSRSCKVIRALPGGEPVPPIDVYALLLDGPEPGSGQPWAWAGLKTEQPQHPARPPLERGAMSMTPPLLPPVFIAGGLTPENVAEAIRITGAQGVDVASGVEVDGMLCPERIASFISNAKSCP